MMQIKVATRKTLRRIGCFAVAGVIIGSTALAPAAMAGPALPSAPATRLVVRVNVDEAQVGERIWLTVSGLSSSATVTVQQRGLVRVAAKNSSLDGKPGGSDSVANGGAYAPRGKWQTIGDAHKVKGGSTRLHVRVEGPAQYRIVAKGTATRRSSAVNVPTFAVGKTLEERQHEASSKLGKPTTKVRSLPKAKLRKLDGVNKKVKAVRWRAFKEGALVEVTRGKKVRTWITLGTIGESYRRAGGPTSSWGIPTADAKCGLMQSGCVQSFTARTAYSSTRTTSAVTAKSKGKLGEVEAALRSWLGFRVTYAKNTSTPIQKWMGSSAAWCGYFQVWGFHASGNADLLPSKKKLIPFPTMRTTVKREMKTSSKPKIGALAFVRTQRGREAGHAGLVTAISKTHIRLLHGNTTGNGTVPRGHRGVVETWVSRSTAAFYAYPKY